MRSMTGYGRGQCVQNGAKFSVELNSVNRKQSDVVVTLPRELAELEPRVRDVINSEVSRGRLNVVVAMHGSLSGSAALALDRQLARNFYKSMLDLQKELGATGEITIETILRAPGVLRAPEAETAVDEAWPPVETALKEALGDLVKMREREGKHLAKDLIKRLKLVRTSVRKIRQLQPAVVKRYRQSLHDRIERAGIELPLDDERLVKEVIFFAEKSDITEELTRLESHFAQFAHHLRKHEPVGRTLEFMSQEIGREFNTLGAKANDVEISQLVVTCKAEMEKIREQIQNIE
ncbi:MAG TPA: YicC/YloC family endoribonuclease [Chthoniobacteraceae bacterium]|nr:YicC/YloC family endoribonuclease [Chthoniobacteraceae bacterium]